MSRDIPTQLSEGQGERIKDIHYWVESFCPPAIAAPGLIEFLDLLVKDGENGARRVARLKLGSEWMFKEVFLCAFFVCFQGIIENQLEVGE
jgi:hypothetical protein